MHTSVCHMRHMHHTSHVWQERFLCPEALFDPHKIGVEAPGIAELTFRSINKVRHFRACGRHE